MNRNMNMNITARLLRSKDACEDQVHIFAKQWPNGAAVTLANCRRAMKLGLDLDWAAAHLLSTAASEAYVEAKVRGWNAREKAMAAARKALAHAATAKATAKARKAIASALEAYDKKMSAAWNAYSETKSAAFYRAWKMDHVTAPRT